MNLISADYVTNTLIENAIAFGYFVLGAVFAIGLILLIYAIFLKVKAKVPKLKKQYQYLSPSEDAAVINAKFKLKEIDLKQNIDCYIASCADVMVGLMKEIAENYTDGEKCLTITLTTTDKKNLDFTVNADFSIEDFLIFSKNTVSVIENTVLTVTDKYGVLVNSFLKIIGLSGNVREITVRDIVFYLAQKAEKKEKKLLKLVEKKKSKEEEQRQKLDLQQQKQRQKLEYKQKKEREQLSKPSDKKSKEKRFLSLFANKSDDKKVSIPQKYKSNKKDDNKRFGQTVKTRFTEKESNELVEKDSSEQKLGAFNKPINKVIAEIMGILIDGMSVEMHKLYGRGYKQNDIEAIFVESELSDDNKGGDNA